MNYIAIYNHNNVFFRKISVLLLISMITYLFPLNYKHYYVNAQTLAKIGKITRTAVVNVGALIAGYMGGVLGIALGGGPLGMVAGAVGGFIIGKKFLNWTTESVVNAATVVGAIAGGVLCAGMGFPILAAGVMGGAILGRVVTKVVKNLFHKTTGKKNHIVRLKVQDVKAQDFINQLTKDNTNTKSQAANQSTNQANNNTSANVDLSQVAYEKYINAYKAYISTLQKGNSSEVQKAYAEYKKCLDEYNATLGKK